MIRQPSLWTNTDEADLLVWLHCVHWTKIIYSPDRDVYHIGLTAVTTIPTNIEVIVQLIQLNNSLSEKGSYI